MDNKRPTPATGIFLIVLLITLLLLGAGVYFASSGQGSTVLVAGCVSLVILLCTFAIAQSAGGAQRQVNDFQQQLYSLFNDRLQQISVMLNQLSEQQLLSDRAKSVAFREKDRDALRRAIQEEIAKKDWEAALVLADDIERTFGYKQEAERLRVAINANRMEVVRKQIAEMVAVVDRYVRGEQWHAAQSEAERIQQMFPNNEQVAHLPRDIEARRANFKKQLVDSWNDAVAKKDVDGSIEILKRLDVYLTPTEAESMQETARSVFKAKLDLLRSEFSGAVTRHDWAGAIRIGESIVRDFPNSRIAFEVREMMDMLHQRAGQPADATA